MFKIASTIDPEGLREARGVLSKIYEENPSYWPYGLSPEHFDGGLYLVQTKQAGQTVGFVGWQERRVPVKVASGPKQGQHHLGRFEKVGYYSIGILPEFRRNGFAKQAISSLLSIKSAGVDRVEALIMDSNTPSKALAKKLGVQMRIKKANTLRSLFRSPVYDGILGPTIKNLAKSKGLVLDYSPASSELGSFVGSRLRPVKGGGGASGVLKHLSDIGLFPKFVTSQRDKTPGYRVSVTGATSPRGGWSPQPATWGDDKLMEASIIKDIPRSVDLAGYLPKGRQSAGSMQVMQRRLAKEFPKGYVIKEQLGSAANQLMTDKTSPTELIRNLNPRELYMAQERRSLAAQGPVSSWLESKIPAPIRERYQNTARGTQEYRVHAINGRVVPYASSQRGNIVGAVTEPLLPWRSSKMRKAEAEVQAALDRLPQGQKRDRVFGFDVGIDKTGKPFLIEANPSNSGGASSNLETPLVMDAVAAAIKGEIPNYVKARRLAWGSGAGLAGLGAYNGLIQD